ncbi:MAG: trehalase-like domain-containing protein [Bacteroidota bacterium]
MEPITKHHQYRMGLVGNCSYLAYIDEAAAVKWLCWPRFDSSFVFGSLLDSKVGGEFAITPTGVVQKQTILCYKHQRVVHRV